MGARIIQGSVVIQTVLGGLTKNASSYCKFPTVYVCQNYENRLTINKVDAIITRQHWTECMTFTAENNATHLQWQLGGQRGTCSCSVAGQVPAVISRQTDRQTDKHTDAKCHNTFSTHLSGSEGKKLENLLDHIVVGVLATVTECV